MTYTEGDLRQLTARVFPQPDPDDDPEPQLGRNVVRREGTNPGIKPGFDAKAFASWVFDPDSGPLFEPHNDHY